LEKEGLVVGDLLKRCQSKELLLLLKRLVAEQESKGLLRKGLKK
jgi:hypothetical protein